MVMIGWIGLLIVAIGIAKWIDNDVDKRGEVMEQLSLDIGIELEDSLNRQTDSRRRWKKKLTRQRKF